MKIVLKSLSGKSIVVDVSPNDTFMDLQSRTLKQTGCFLNLHNFKYKGHKITTQSNVMKYFQGVTEHMNAGKEKDGSSVSEDISDSLMSANTVTLEGDTAVSNVCDKEFSHKGDRVALQISTIPEQSSFIIPRKKKCLIPLNSIKNSSLDVGDQESQETSTIVSYLNKNVNNKKEMNFNELITDLKITHNENCNDVDNLCKNNKLESGASVLERENPEIISANSFSKLDVNSKDSENEYFTENIKEISTIESSVITDQNNTSHESVDIVNATLDCISSSESKENQLQPDVSLSYENEVCSEFEIYKSANDLKPLEELSVSDKTNNGNELESFSLCESVGSASKENHNESTDSEFQHESTSMTMDATEIMTEDALSKTTSLDETSVTSIKHVIPSEKLTNSDLDDTSDHPGQLCRLCALPRQTMVYIFSEAGLHLGLRSKINTWLPIHVSRTDPLPKQVCDFCMERLNQCQEFGTSCVKAQQVLNKMFENRKFRCKTPEDKDKSSSKIDTSNEIEEIQLNVEDNKSKTNSETKISAFNSNIKSKMDSQLNLVKSEPTSSEEEESDLISEDSSENELVDMILSDNDEPEGSTAVQSNYCCPLCCDGKMVTVKQSSMNMVLSLSKASNTASHAESNIERANKKKFCTENTINSNIEVVRHRNNEFIKNDNGLTFEDDPEEQFSDSDADGDSDSFILNYMNVKLEDDSHGIVATRDQGSNDIDNNAEADTKQDTVISKSESIEEINSDINCVVCGETEISLNQYLVHTLRVHGDSEAHIYPCSLCEMCFSVDTDLTRHFMNVHQNIKVARLLHVCTVCGRQCASQRALKSHVCIPINSVTDQLACTTCGQSFSTKARLMFHHQFHAPDARPLECVPCAMVFAEEENLYDHIRFSHRGQAFMCSECGGHFNSKAALRGHVRSHRNLRLHKCEVCSKTFLDKQTLKEHSVSHMEVKPFQCHLCGKYLNRNSRLKKHLMSHELQKTTKPQECFQCAVCGETFPNEPKAIAHAQVGHAMPSETECVFQLFPIEKVYRCEFCERCYANPVYLNTHRSSHVDESIPYKCHICGAGFATFARVATHKVTHGVYEKKDEFTIPKLYLCDACDKAYVHWTYLSVHRKMIHAEVKHMYKCKMCPEQFVNSWSLAYHRKTRHCESAPPPLDSSVPASERKRWKCEYCEKRYVSQHSLLAHISMLHTGDSPGPHFQCDQCGKRFARKISLDSHKKTHNGTKPFMCPLCKKTFVHSSGLSSHLRLHRGDKPHSCQYCGKTFLQRGDRDDHVRKHTGERPFTCQHCPKSFRTRAMWFEHMRIHRDERPFPCDICGAAFRRSYALKNHKTIHTGERPHACSICGKAFRQKQDMQKHLKNHHQFIQVQECSEDVLTIVLPTP